MVAKLTIQQKNSLVGKEFTKGAFFNPIQDINNDWIISKEEVIQCDNQNFLWVKALVLTEYLPKPTIQL